jgi:integrating conjugative element protein (TIGR03761 family)
MAEEKHTAQGPRAGALKSSLSIELHSHYAIRLWAGRPQGRSPAGSGRKRAEIISMPKAISRAGRIYQDSAADNPYADAAMCALEQAIMLASEEMNRQVAETDTLLKALPAKITLTEIASVEPLNIGVYSRSPLGYRCVWLLVGFDQLALRVFQAHHYGLISRQRRDAWLSQGSHLVRRVYAIVQAYHSVAVVRDDIINGTPAGLEAINRFGMPDDDIMSGKCRSGFSPPLRRMSVPALSAAPAEEDAGPQQVDTLVAGSVRPQDQEPE